MPKNIEPKLKKIGEYLRLEKSAVFLVPEYQRAYSWEIKHCDKLWQDINAFIDSGSKDKYFFGTIIINCIDKDNDNYYDTELRLIDGQQRTTTFLLLLKAMLLRLNSAIAGSAKDEESEGLVNGLKARRDTIMSILFKAEVEDIPEYLKDNDRIKDIEILKNDSINEIYKSELAMILEAEDFSKAENRVIKIKNKQKDNKYTNYFRNFKYFHERLKDESDSKVNILARSILGECEIIEIRSWQVGQAIAMFNSLNSDGMPLFDADIISAQLYSEAAKLNENKKFNERWRELLYTVNKLDSQKIANIDAILMQYMYINRARQKEYVSEAGSISVTTPGLRRYYTEINKSLLNEPLSLCEELLKISQIWLKIIDYPIVKLLLKFNENIKLYLSGYLSRYTIDNITEENINGISYCLLKLFAILELVDLGYSSSKFKSFLFGEIIKLVDSNTDIAEIERDFNEHIQQSWKRDDIKETVFEYDKNILVYLNEYLFAKRKNLVFLFTEKYDIEHIMPASGINILAIRRDAGLSDESEFQNYVNKLGNKILLEAEINRAIQNGWFRTKILNSVKDKTGYKDSKYAIASDLVMTYEGIDKPSWLKEDIDSATEKIAHRMCEFIFNES